MLDQNSSGLVVIRTSQSKIVVIGKSVLVVPVVDDEVVVEVVGSTTVTCPETCPEILHLAVTLRTSPSTAGMLIVSDIPDVLLWLV